MIKKGSFAPLADISVKIPKIDVDEIHRRKVEKTGTGAHIVFLKAHIGKEVLIIVGGGQK